MKKKLNIFLLILVICFAIAGCAKKDAEPPKDSAPLVVTDEQKLVEIVIENGVASLNFDLPRWAELFRDNGSANEEFAVMKKGPYTIETLSGKVKNACVGRVAEMDWISQNDFILPSIILLMEDGSLEWLLADPFLFDQTDSAYSLGRLPWLKDIVSLSFEPAREGIGENTFFAEDKNGLHYDLKVAQSFIDIFAGVWIAAVGIEPEVHSDCTAYLQFFADGETIFIKESSGDYSQREIYKGQYQVYLDEEGSGRYRAGIIAFDLTLQQNEAGKKNLNKSPAKIKGTFFAEANDASHLHLWVSDGDPLHFEQGKPVEYYDFTLNYSVETPQEVELMSSEELIDYLLASVPEAQQLVRQKGMAVLVTGESTKLPEAGYCRDVWLGTDHQDSFVREILFTISKQGMVYKYDPLGDGWIQVNIFN